MCGYIQEAPIHIPKALSFEGFFHGGGLMVLPCSVLCFILLVATGEAVEAKNHLHVMDTFWLL